jgi:AsmA protein
VKRFFKIAGILIAVLLLAVISLPFFINVDQFRPTLQADLTTALGRDVQLGNLHLKVTSGEVTADDLSVAEDPAFGKPAFLKARSLHVGVEILPFIVSRKLIVTDMTIDQPEIVLVQAPTGDWNFSSLGGKSKASVPATAPSARMPLDLSVKLVKVTNGRLTLRRTLGHWKPLVLERVGIELRDFSANSAFPFSLATDVRGGGTLKLSGKAGPINPVDSAMTPVTATLSVAQLDLAKSGINDFAPELAGLASLDGTGESDGRNLHLNGKLKVEKLKLAKGGSPATRPVDFDFSVQHDLRKHAGVMQRGDIHVGRAPAHLTGGYAEQGESVVLNMKLNGPNMPINELESLLPALAIVLPAGTTLQGGTASANLTFDGPADRLVTRGSLAVNGTHLAGFDLSKKMSAIEKLAGVQGGPNTEIQTLSANLRVAPDGTEAQDIKLLVPALGDLTGDGTVSPANALNFKMSAMVHTSGLLAVAGNRPIPFIVSGTCSDPVFRPDMKAVIRNEAEGVGGAIGGDVGRVAGGIIGGLLGGRSKK